MSTSETQVRSAAAAAWRSGVGVALVASLSFALMSLCVRVAGRSLPTGELATARGVVSLVVVSALQPDVLRRCWQALSSRDGLTLWGRSLGGALSMGCYFVVLESVPIATARALADLAPALVVILGGLLGLERPGLRRATAVFTMVLGAVTLNAGGLWQTAPRVVVIGTIGAVAGSVAYLGLKAATTRWSQPVIVCALSLVTAAMGPFLSDAPWRWPDASDGHPWLLGACVVGVGVFGVIGQLLMTRSYALLPASTASALQLSLLVFGAAIDVVMTGTLPPTHAWLSYVLIVGGGVALQLTTSRHSAD